MRFSAGNIINKIGVFKAYLSIWILIAIFMGLVFGSRFPILFQSFASFKVGEVNPAMALLMWLLILPSMVEVEYSKFRNILTQPQWRSGLTITVFINWVIKPLVLTGLAMFFFHVVFSAWMPNADHYVAGLILLGIAPCTGMVFVWSRMSGGDNEFTVSQVTINNIILLVAYTPIAGFLLGISGITIPWRTLLASVAAYVVAPLLFGYLIRRLLLYRYKCYCAIETFSAISKPITKIGLILVVFLLFGVQAETVLEQPLIILMIAIPLIIQGYLIFALTVAWASSMNLPSSLIAPAALIGTSNFFELAVAIAISLFGISSPTVVATTVGVLVEVPVMLSLVYLLQRYSPS